MPIDSRKLAIFIANSEIESEMVDATQREDGLMVPDRELREMCLRSSSFAVAAEFLGLLDNDQDMRDYTACRAGWFGPWSVREILYGLKDAEENPRLLHISNL